jgi:two-component system, cell cycle sensor histidine kinase and response regulator CckA
MSSRVQETEPKTHRGFDGPDRPARVLIVDDQPHDRLLLEVMLASEGLVLLSAASGEEALAMVTQQPIDLILLDVRMTGMDGCQVTARIKGNPATQHIPVIMITGLDDREARKLGLSAGAEEFLSKPVDRAELRVRVRNLLRLKAYADASDKYSQMLEGEVVSRTADLVEGTTTLEALRRQYELVLDSIADGVHGIDLLGRITIENQVAAQMFGWDPLEIVGRPAHPTVHHSRADGTPYPEEECPIHSTLRDGAIRRITDEIFWRKDGGSFPVEYLAAPMRDAQGGVAGVVVTFRDITARRDAERERRESEEQYRLLFESNPHPMYVFDAETLAFLAVNEAAVHHYGHARKELLGMSIREIGPSEQVPALIDAIRAAPTGHVSSESLGVFSHRRKDGLAMQMDVAASRLRFQGRDAFLCLAMDVTEKQNLEAQLLQSQKMESVGRLAGGIAHDFNNLLGVILGYSALLLGKVEDVANRAKLEQIVKAGDRAAGLTRQLLAFSRKQVLQPRILDLNDLVADMEKMLRRLIGEDIQLITLLDGVGNVKADPGQIEQVLMNLVVNARDAMPRGGRLTIQTSNVMLDGSYAAERPDRPGPCVMLSVSDTGVGMTAEIQRKIFEPFFTTKGPTEGTGLGLATSDGIVKQSGGHIAVDSQLGHGSTFRVYLPRINEEAHPAIAPPAVSRLGTETILLAEDEPALRELTREVLEEHGYTVIVAGSGDGALKRAGTYPGAIDLLLTDVVMPRLSGRELAERLARLRPGLRVIFMSGYTDDAVVRHGVLVPSTAFIQKPFGPESLLAKIREVLDRPDRAPGKGPVHE